MDFNITYTKRVRGKDKLIRKRKGSVVGAANLIWKVSQRLDMKLVSLHINGWEYDFPWCMTHLRTRMELEERVEFHEGFYGDDRGEG